MRTESKVMNFEDNRLGRKITNTKTVENYIHSATDTRLRRKRFHVREGGFVALSPYREKVGQIVDINLEGLSFVYILREDKPINSKNLEIFFLDNRFYLDQIPFRIVYEYRMDRQGLPGCFQMRRCGIAFGHLSAYHRHNLEHFIENFSFEPKK